jgi:hypothetical protein
MSPFFWAPMGIISFPYTVLSLIFLMRKESNKTGAETPSNTRYSMRSFDIFSPTPMVYVLFSVFVSDESDI